MSASAGSRRNHVVHFSGLKQDFIENGDRHRLSNEFKKFGVVTKLYVDPSLAFGSVFYSSYAEAVNAIKNLNNAPPFYLTMSFNQNTSDDRNSVLSVGTSTGPKSNKKSKMFDEDILGEFGEQKVDVFGNKIDTVVDDNGVIYVPLNQVKASGFEMFDPKNFDKKLKNNEQILRQFYSYMLGKAKKFMLSHEVTVREKDINEIINRCEVQIFGDDNKNGPRSAKKFSPRSEESVHENGTPSGSRNRLYDSNSPIGVSPLRKPRTPYDPKSAEHPAESVTNNTLEKKKRYSQDIVTVTLPKNQYQEVKVTHVENETSCWVNLMSEVETVESILYDCNRTASTGKDVPASVGRVYGSKLNGAWARVRILSTRPAVEGLFVDYGVKQTIQELRTLPPDLFMKPIQAVLIEFESNVHVKKDDILSVKATRKLENKYIVEVKKGGSESPVLMSSTVSKEPSKAEVSVTTPSSLASTSTTNTDLVTKAEVPTRSITPSQLRKISNAAKQPVEEKTKPKCVIDVDGSSGILSCTKILDAETFVAYVLDENYIDDITLLEGISEECKPDASFKPKIGDLVSVKKEDEDAWVRAIVIEINDKYNCALIDYGITLECEEIRRLPDKYQDVIEFSCICKTDAKTAKAIESGPENMAYSVIAKNKLKLTLEDSSYTVEAKRWNPLSKVDVPEAVKQKIFTALPPTSDLNDGDTVKIISTDKNFLLVQTKTSSEFLKEVVAEIKSFAAAPLVTQPVIGQLVLAPCEGETGLFRGVVKEINKTVATVSFFDYGNEDQVPTKNLHTINEKLATTPIALIKTPKLKDFEGSEFDVKVLEFLEKRIKQKCKTIFTKDREEVDFQYPDDVLLSSSFKPEKVVVEKSEPAEVPKVPQDNSPKSTDLVLYSNLPQFEIKPGQHNLMCIYTNDLEEATVTFIKGDAETTETLEKLSSLIEEYVATALEPYKPTLYEVCIAKYEDSWYRSVIMEELSSKGTYSVFFIDYGNTDIINSVDVRKLPKELVKMPALALVCSLDGILKDNKDSVGGPLLKRLKELIEDNQMYEVDILSNSDVINVRIPSVYEKLKAEKLIS